MKIVHNRLLGGWFIVRGAHQTPISGRFDSKEQAQAHLNRRHLPEPDETYPAPVRGIRMSGSPFARGY